MMVLVPSQYLDLRPESSRLAPPRSVIYVLLNHMVILLLSAPPTVSYSCPFGKEILMILEVINWLALKEQQ